MKLRDPITEQRCPYTWLATLASLFCACLTFYHRLLCTSSYLQCLILLLFCITLRTVKEGVPCMCLFAISALYTHLTTLCIKFLRATIQVLLLPSDVSTASLGQTSTVWKIVQIVKTSNISPNTLLSLKSNWFMDCNCNRSPRDKV